MSQCVILLRAKVFSHSLKEHFSFAFGSSEVRGPGVSLQSLGKTLPRVRLHPSAFSRFKQGDWVCWRRDTVCLRYGVGGERGFTFITFIKKRKLSIEIMSF